MVMVMKKEPEVQAISTPQTELDAQLDMAELELDSDVMVHADPTAAPMSMTDIHDDYLQNIDNLNTMIDDHRIMTETFQEHMAQNQTQANSVNEQLQRMVDLLNEHKLDKA